MSTEISSASILIYIQRLKTHFGVKRDDELAEKIGLSKQAISNWKTRNKVPLKFQQTMLDQYGIGYVEWSITYSPKVSDVTYAVALYCCHQLLKGIEDSSGINWRNFGQVFPQILDVVGKAIWENPSMLTNADLAIELLQSYYDAGRFTAMNEVLRQVIEID